MTKKLLILLGTIVVAFGILITLGAIAYNSQPKEDSMSVGKIVDEMNSLRDLKQECADNLGIKDSAKFLKGMTGYCDSWDEEIQSLREQAEQLQKKEYESALGLAQNR